MTIRIGSNIPSLQAQRRLGEASDTVTEALTRLSSGLRINRASDDAAGLAASTSLKATARIYSRSILNVNDYVSALQIAAGAASEISNVLGRISELAEQSANGTFSTTQRGSMNKEADQLRKEINRIMQTTKFQGISLLDGTFNNSSVQIGSSTASLFASIGNIVGSLRPDGTFNTSVTYQGDSLGASAATTADLNGDGILDLVVGSAQSANAAISVSYGNGDGSFGAPVSYGGTGAVSIFNGVATGDLNGDGYLDIVGQRNNGDVLVLSGAADGSFTVVSTFTTVSNGTRPILADFNGDGKLDLITTPQAASAGFTLSLGNGDGTFRAQTTIAGATSPRNAKVADVNRDGIIDLVIANNGGDIEVYTGNGNGTFKHLPTYTALGGTFRDLQLGDLNGDGVLDIAAPSLNGLSILYGNSDGSFSAPSTLAFAFGTGKAGEIADFNDDDLNDIAFLSSTGVMQILLNNGDGTFRMGVSRSIGAVGGGTQDLIAADFNRDGLMDLVATNQTASVGLSYLQGSGVAGIAPFDLSSISTARIALDRVKTNIESLGQGLGTIGTHQSRLGYARAVLTSMRDNYLAASSRIEDADIAEESSKLIRGRILQQVGASILAQANQIPSLALSLLKG